MPFLPQDRNAWTGGGNVSEPRNQFTFYRSYYDAIQELPKKDQSAIILAVCNYAIYEVEPKGLSAAASTAFKLIRPTLDAGRKKAQSGKQGGSKTKAKGKQTAREKEVEIENEYEKEIENEYEYEKEIEACPSVDAISSFRYGGSQNVILRDDEYASLVSEFTEINVTCAINQLGSWLKKGGETKDSHYTLLRRKLLKDPVIPVNYV